MAPKRDIEIVGRHGVIGVDVLPRDVQFPLNPTLSATVDEMFERIDKRHINSPESKRAVNRGIEDRGGQIAVADTVSIVEL